MSIIIVMMVFGEYTTRAKESQISLIENVMEKMAENQKEQFEYYVEEKIHTLKVLVTYPDIYKMDETAQKNFVYGRSGKWGFNHPFIVDMNGMGYYIEEDIHRNQSSEDFFYNIKKNDVYITEPFYTGYGVAIITVCVSIYDEQGEKVGVLCGAVDLNNVQQIINKNEMILEGNSYILSNTGQYVTSQNASDIYNKSSIFSVPDSELSVVEEAFKEQADKSGIITLKGIEYQTYIAYLPDYRWAIVQNIPIAKITERYSNINWMQYILAFFIVLLICCIIRIIYCWKKSDKKIYTDTLTGCNSRAACFDLLDYLEENRKQQITIIYMDLNRFKWVNDTYGHEKGDELLKDFADVLGQTLGKQGFVGRMGGDEFIAVLLDISEQEILELWQQVEEKLRQQSEKLGLAHQIASSYGYASRAVGEMKSLNSVLQMADKKMYENKAVSKNRNN